MVTPSRLRKVFSGLTATGDFVRGITWAAGTEKPRPEDSCVSEFVGGGSTDLFTFWIRKIIRKGFMDLRHEKKADLDYWMACFQYLYSLIFRTSGVVLMLFDFILLEHRTNSNQLY